MAIGHAGETSTPAAIMGQFPPITPVLAFEGIIQLTTSQYIAMQEQMYPPANTNNAINGVNPPLAPVVPNDVVVPANIAVVASPPTGNQIAPANSPLLPGWGENPLRALTMIKKQRKPIYKLHGMSPFIEEVRQARLPKGFRLSESLKYKGTTNPIDYLDKFNAIMEVDQVPQLTKCRILAITSEDNAHN
uniref:Uncharacterized protein n=1 Tax=Cannabis sativa TaxID=3483 RepID=A0A803NMA9_CANSA